MRKWAWAVSAGLFVGSMIAFRFNFGIGFLLITAFAIFNIYQLTSMWLNKKNKK